MSKIFFSILLVILVAAGGFLTCKYLITSEKQEATGKRVTSMKILDSRLDLGTFPFSETREGVYRIVNEGKNPLIILEATTSCNCTDLEWPMQPISPGDTARVHVTYTPNARGRFSRTIDLYCNTVPPVTLLRLEGHIE
jgi:hypothetical protein